MRIIKFLQISKISRKVHANYSKYYKKNYNLKKKITIFKKILNVIFLKKILKIFKNLIDFKNNLKNLKNLKIKSSSFKI